MMRVWAFLLLVSSISAARAEESAVETSTAAFDSMEATAIIGGMALAGSHIAESIACRNDGCEGLENLLERETSLVAGYVVGALLGMSWYDDRNDHDGSFGFASLGWLAGGGVGLMTYWLIGEPESVKTALPLLTATAGAGVAYVLTGQSRGRCSDTSAFLTPVGDGGYGLGVAGGF
jgi:hypothetical protein